MHAVEVETNSDTETNYKARLELCRQQRNDMNILQRLVDMRVLYIAA